MRALGLPLRDTADQAEEVWGQLETSLPPLALPDDWPCPMTGKIVAS